RARERSGWRSGGDQLPDHLPLDEGQALVAPQVRIGQPALVQPELVQDRRVDVAEVVWLLDRAEADRVGGPDDPAPPDAAAGHPHREAAALGVATPTALRLRAQ